MFKGSLSLVAYDIQPVVDFNQVTHHFLECIFTRLCVRNPAKNPLNKVAGLSAGPSSMTSTGYSASGAMGMPLSAGATGSGTGLDNVQELILKCFEREGDTESGVDIRKIVQ